MLTFGNRVSNLGNIKETNKSPECVKKVLEKVLKRDGAFGSFDSTMAVGELTADLDTTFETIRNKMNPTKFIQAKRIFNLSDTNINNYAQPIEIYDRKRIWGKKWNKFWSISKRNAKDPFVKIHQMKGFKDPLKLYKKCHPKITATTNQSFILFHEDWKYIPPPKPAMSLSCLRSSTESIIKLISPPPIIEMKTMGKYNSPKVPKHIKCKRRRRTALRIPEVTDLLQENTVDIYRAPQGSKENYSCKKFTAFTDADRALDEVCSLISVLRKPAKRREIVATLVTDKIPDELVNAFVPTEPEVGNTDETCSSIAQETLDNNVLKSGDKTGDGPGPDIKPEETCLIEKHEICKLNEATSDISNPIENNNGDSYEKVPSVCQENNDDPSTDSTFAIDLVEVNYCQKPHIVRRRLKESTSIAKWIDENILCEFHKMRKSAEVNLSLKHCYEPPFNDISSKSGSYKDFQEKYFSPFQYEQSKTSLRKEPENTPPVVTDDEVLLPSEVNSIDELVKEQETNPSVFRAYEVLSKKKFTNYGIDDILFTSWEKFQANSSCNLSDTDDEDDAVKRSRNSFTKSRITDEYMDNWWRQSGKYVIFTENVEDEGYLASEEDDPPKSVNDYESWKKLYKSEEDLTQFDPYSSNLEKKLDSDSNSKCSLNDSDSECDRFSEEANFDVDEHRSSLESLDSIMLFEDYSSSTLHKRTLSISMENISWPYECKKVLPRRTRSLSLGNKGEANNQSCTDDSIVDIFYSSRNATDFKPVKSLTDNEDTNQDTAAGVRNKDWEYWDIRGSYNVILNSRGNKGRKITKYLSWVCSKCTFWLKSKSKKVGPRR